MRLQYFDLCADAGDPAVVSTRKYANTDADPAKVGRELHVGTVVTGHFLEQNKKVMVTLETVEVNRTS